ncbi:inositol-3-phosphate synthase [Salinibacter ruber]|uniref:inositol-3-phosphate synthase n=1 Tax=Salinibacter ruber TaxID=146919 RepID=UPI002169736E|nr:inositol-3-phosphate synthase [Salinibacter ruber]
MASSGSPSGRLGVAIVGLGGAVATTTVAGIELMRSGNAKHHGLPLAALDESLTQGLASYESLVFGGWDFYDVDLEQAAENHDVLDPGQLEEVRSSLGSLSPWPAVGNERFCREVTGDHQVATSGHRETVDTLQDDLRRFKSENDLDNLVVVNLASTEARADPSLPVYGSEEAFRNGIEENHEAISPAMLYAFAAIDAGVPYVNFTPSLAADTPALREMASRLNVPVAGKDGKTGQTLLKTILAPGLRSRALNVDGWYSTNILGNRDGRALSDEDSLASKVETKGSVLDSILGYEVEDHIVDIRYYGPRGDNKEAWDNIDLTGFLGKKMQLKLNFLCRDSILAAPLVIELVRCVDLADRTEQGGVQEHLGVFFKSPMVEKGHVPEHGLPSQQRALHQWLERVHSSKDGASPSEENGEAGIPASNGTESSGTESNGKAPESAAPSGNPSSSVADR